jgi:hypothetical protein
MAVDVKASLRQEIDRLRRAIAEKTSELASLNDGLRRHERALALLGDRAVGARTHQVKTRRPALVSWDTVFKQLPNTFTVKDIIKRPESKGRLLEYLRRVAGKWATRGQTKGLAQGNIRKSNKRNSALPNHRAQRFQNGGNCAPPMEKISSSFSKVTR